MQHTTAALTRKLGYGSYASHGIKRVLGKVPVNMSGPRAQSVIDELRSRWADHPDNVSVADQIREELGQESW